MKSTALTVIHEGLGAKMVPFAGYNMPVLYKGISVEHETVRNGVGVFDVSHMGEFILKGPHALELVQKITTNDAAKLVAGKVQYSCMPNHTGGIVDDLLVYCLSQDSFMLVVNASNIEKDWDWISKHDTWNVQKHDISDKTTLLAVQGPLAVKALQLLTEINLGEMEYYTFEKGVFAGVENVLISATGYTGAGGFEIYFEHQHSRKIWNAIFEAGQPFGIQPVGLGVRDPLRLEMGFCLYGNDIDDATSPIEAGLGWITRFTKDFINSAALKEQKEKGVSRKLIAFEMTDRGIPRQGYPIYDNNENEIGSVTSGTHSPTLQKSIGMGYVTIDSAATGNNIMIGIRDKYVPAVIVKLPFYKK
jgi:aminomethyltransferase